MRKEKAGEESKTDDISCLFVSIAVVATIIGISVVPLLLLLGIYEYFL